MRGHPDNVTPTRRIKLDAWPPQSLFRRVPMGNGYVNDTCAMEEWDRLRCLAMSQWRGSEARNVVVSIVFKGAKSQVEFGPLSSSILKMLHRAGILESNTPNCIKRLQIRASRSPVESVEIGIRELHRRVESGRNLTHGMMLRLMRRNHVTLQAIAPQVGVSFQFVSAVLNGRKTSRRVEIELQRIAAQMMGHDQA